MAVLGAVQEAQLWTIDHCDCGVSTLVRVDSSSSGAHIDEEAWRPSHCPNCGHKVRR